MKRTNFRRRAQGVTDYKRRLGLLKAGKTRLVVRRTSNNIIAQLVDYKPEGDKILATVDIVTMKKLGWRMGANTPLAYLVGFELGRRAKKLKVKEAIMDIGRHSVSSKLFAVLKGAIDAGLIIPYDEKVLPSQSRIEGKAIQDYMGKSKGNQFSKLKKEKISVTKDFDEILSKLKRKGVKNDE